MEAIFFPLMKISRVEGRGVCVCVCVGGGGGGGGNEGDVRSESGVGLELKWHYGISPWLHMIQCA